MENIVRKGRIAFYKQFSFSHNVFHSYISLMHQNAALCGNGLKQKRYFKLRGVCEYRL